MKKRIGLVLMCVVMLANMFLPAHAGVTGDSLLEHNWVLYEDYSGLVPRYKTVESCELESYEHTHYTLASLQRLTYFCADCGEEKVVYREFYNEPWICCLHDNG